MSSRHGVVARQTNPRSQRPRLNNRTDIYNRLYHNVTMQEASTRQIHRLPALASSIFNETIDGFGWEPRLTALLAGTRDELSPLRFLRGFEDTLVRHIYTYTAAEWAEHITLTIPASCVGRTRDGGICRYSYGRPRRGEEEIRASLSTYDMLPDLPLVSGTGDGNYSQGFVSFCSCGMVQFPEPSNRNVNMMPFIIGNKASLPEYLQCYYECAIEQCPYSDEEIGKVGYLTVQESYVEAGLAQRRGGLHIESPGIMYDEVSATFSPAYEHSWGQGVFFEHDRIEGGIYMASSVADTSEVWDALVHKKNGIVDRHGGCEYLRPLIGPGTKLKANELVWMTDRTPHEAIAQQSNGYRQFFRFVTSQISHWYAEHSTVNPLVPLPDDVVVVRDNKFA